MPTNLYWLGCIRLRLFLVFGIFCRLSVGDRNLSRDKSQTDKEISCFTIVSSWYKYHITISRSPSFRMEMILLKWGDANRKRLVQFIRMLVDWLLMNLWCRKFPKARGIIGFYLLQSIEMKNINTDLCI